MVGQTRLKHIKMQDINGQIRSFLPVCNPCNGHRPGVEMEILISMNLIMERYLGIDFQKFTQMVNQHYGVKLEDQFQMEFNKDFWVIAGSYQQHLLFQNSLKE